MYGVLCGDVSWTAVCMAFCVEMKLDCSMYGVLCGDVSWTAVCMAFCVEMKLDCSMYGVLCGDEVGLRLWRKWGLRIIY
jgi:hypothetical protein